MPKKLSIQPFRDFFNKIQMKLSEASRKMVGSKPSLNYLEVHLVGHCNLNCKGCSHFSPLANEQFTDVNDYKKDLEQLEHLFSNINRIVLLGGEPLLNPKIEEFIKFTRLTFKKTKIVIATNGFLLPKMSVSFWETCRKYSVDIDITIYPPLKLKESNLIKLVRDKNLRVFVHSITTFHAFYNPKGNSNSLSTFRLCRKRWYTPMLNEGKIYVCPKPATIKYFNQKFGLNLPNSGFVDIYSPNLDGWKIKELLDKPSPLCSYCTLGWEIIPTFPWEKSKLELTDWQAPCKNQK